MVRWKVLDYRVGENYEYAVVGEPKRISLDSFKNKQLPVGSVILQRLETVHHYDTSKLIVSPEFQINSTHRHTLRAFFFDPR